MTLARPLAEYESVQGWRTGLAQQWGGDPLAEDAEKLLALESFCAFVGKEPDELLAFCFLRRKATGERFGSVERREQVAAWLREWRAQSGLTGAAARKRVNDVLSFLIHGGVMIHPGMV
ncbi:MAG TPA: hypothetical protein VMS86_16015 [Thermoanaerobaculia bacterium]|nr:hypothetical protein [Thermoanaerobaculia bacterium]